MCRRLDDSEELMEEGRLAGLDGTIMQVMIKVVMVKIMLMMEGIIMQFCWVVICT